MKTQRLSFDMSVEDHMYLKMCCAKLGVSIKDFAIKAINEKVEAYEDEWLFADSFEDNDGENILLIDHDGKRHAI